MLDNYEVLPNGVIHQIKVNKLKTYDKKYIDDRYNSYGEKGVQMAYLRLGYLAGVIQRPIKKILDIGYGNGDFLNACRKSNINSFGNDISGYPIPIGCTYVEDVLKDKYDVVSFFDSLEHFEDISFVKDLQTEYIIISVPYCHRFSDEWFKNWKHRRPDEHLWHFSPYGLNEFMIESGYKHVFLSSIEDAIRKPIDKHTNILTGVFKKR